MKVVNMYQNQIKFESQTRDSLNSTMTHVKTSIVAIVKTLKKTYSLVEPRVRKFSDFFLENVHKNRFLNFVFISRLSSEKHVCSPNLSSENHFGAI